MDQQYFPNEWSSAQRLRHQFEDFHKMNEGVWHLFQQYTFQAIRAGKKTYGAQTVIERIRWHTEIETTSAEFKISNNHVAFYARMFHEQYPEHNGFFRIRYSAADNKENPTESFDSVGSTTTITSQLEREATTKEYDHV